MTNWSFACLSHDDYLLSIKQLRCRRTFASASVVAAALCTAGSSLCSTESPARRRSAGTSILRTPSSLLPVADPAATSKPLCGLIGCALPSRQFVPARHRAEEQRPPRSFPLHLRALFRRGPSRAAVA